MDSNVDPMKDDVNQSIDKRSNRDISNRTILSNVIVTPDINDPAYQSSILKILEAKALDCLCAGYSKDHTQKQISQALSDINHR